MNKLEAIEKAFVRFAAVHSSAAKQIARWEFESWLEEALIRVGRLIAAGQDFRLLQKRYSVQLGHYDAPLEFDAEQSYSAAGGWGSGVEVTTAGQAKGTLDSLIFATDAITSAIGAECVKNQYVEFEVVASNKPLSLALWPLAIGLDALKPSPLVEQADILFGLTVEANGALAAYQNGQGVLNPDLTMQATAGDRLRIYFNASGEVIVQHFGATASVLQASYPITTAADPLEPLKISQSFIPVVLFHEDEAEIKSARIGIEEPFLAALDERVIVDSIRTRGRVMFEDNRPLGYVADGNLRGLPRVRNQWHWTDENRQIRIFPSPATQKTFTEAVMTTWRYDGGRRAWVAISVVPAGVTLTPQALIAEYDPDTVRLVAGRSYTIDTTKEEQSVKLPIGATDGAVVQIADSGNSWATNPLTLLASNGDVLLEMPALTRRIIIEANRIPTIEEVPFEAQEAVINALLEIALERKGQPALKQKANWVAAKIPDAPTDVQAAA